MSVLFGKREERTDIVDVANYIRDARTNGSWTPLTFTPESVLCVPPVFACQQYTAGVIAQLPFDEYRKVGEGRVAVDESPLIASPSADVSPEDWRFQAVESAQLHGNAVGLIVSRDRLEYPTQIELVEPTRVQVKWNKTTRLIEWKIDNEVVPTDDVWHMTGRPRIGSPIGVGLVEYMTGSAAVGRAAREYIAKWFDGGGAPTVVVIPEKDPGPTGAARLKASIKTAIASRDPLVLSAAKTEQWPGSKPSDAELVELLRQNATDIAMFYALPPELIGGSSGDSMTYSNVEHRMLDLLAFGVSYWLIKLERALSRELPRARFTKANESAIIRTDVLTRTRVLVEQVRGGLMTPNEGRALLDREPKPGADELVYPPFATQATQAPVGGE